MASFVRAFSVFAHAFAHQQKDRVDEFGVCFLLYTSTVKTADHLSKANLTPVEGSLDDKNRVVRISPKRPSNQTNVVVCCYRPSANKQETATTIADIKTPRLDIRLAVDAAEAIEFAATQGVSRIAVLGYSMLEAGLTIQHVRPPERAGEKKHVFCASHLQLMTADSSSLDGQLQIAGRTFFELKGSVKPTPAQWPIHTLGVQGLADRMRSYQAVETKFAESPAMPLYRALRSSFTFSGSTAGGRDQLSLGELYIDGDSKSSAFVRLGTRRGDLAAILGLSFELASKQDRDRALERAAFREANRERFEAARREKAAKRFAAKQEALRKAEAERAERIERDVQERMNRALRRGAAKS
jgi:hypothetical protein